MKLKVLLIDSDRKWLSKAHKYLKKNLYSADYAVNGREAQLLLYKNRYFAVILNMRVKNHSGVQVLRFVRTNHPTQKVVVILEKNISHDASKDQDGLPMKDILAKYRVDDVLISPFPIDSLKEIIEGHEGIESIITARREREKLSEEEDVYCPDDEFTKIKISQFYSSRQILFDVFIRLKSSRYIKILHAGEKFSKERLNRYQNDKKVEYLHFRKNDIGKYVKFHNFLSKKIVEKDSIDSEIKLTALKNVSEKFLEQSFYEGVHPRVLEQGRVLANNIYELVKKQKDLYKILNEYQEFDPNAYTHSFLVTLFSTAIIRKFKWQSQKTIETCAISCLLHDVGKSKFPKEMLDKRPPDMDKKELEIYRQHPEMGLQLVEGNKLINNSVKQIILQHHEYFDGSGFPHGRSRSKILTLANIVCLADDYVHLMIERKQSPINAIKTFLQENADNLNFYNPIIVDGLAKVFVDSEEILGNLRGSKIAS